MAYFSAPPPPTDIQADQLSPAAVAISFLPPNPPHGILDEYRIRHTPSDRITWQEVRRAPEELTCSGARPERLCFRIGELEPLKEYIVQIAAHTRDGEWGEYSQSKMITTTDAGKICFSHHFSCLQRTIIMFQTFPYQKKSCTSETSNQTASQCSGTV